MTTLITVRGLTRRYGTDPAVLDGIDLDLAAGETLAVVGPSGCGKSTLLNCLGGLDRPDAGSVQFDGRDLATLSDDDRARLRATAIGLVFQEHHLLPQLSALENVLLPTLALPLRPARAAAEQAARALLAAVGLADQHHRRPAELSGGERQRVALARALINRPRLLLADEPTGALDRANAEVVAGMLVELNRQAGTTLVVVTHAAGLAARMARRLTLAGGVLREWTGTT